MHVHWCLCVSGGFVKIVSVRDRSCVLGGNRTGGVVKSFFPFQIALCIVMQPYIQMLLMYMEVFSSDTLLINYYEAVSY